jgi:serine/threonine protein kinase
MSKYKKIKELGRGTYGIVYLAELNSKKYAIKNMIITERTEKVFKREITALEHISRVDKADKYMARYVEHEKLDDGSYNIITEYLEGMTLKTYLQIVGKDKISEPFLKKLMFYLLRGLMFFQENEIVHRDIKMDNIIIHNNVPKFIDFGLSCKSNDEDCLKIFAGSPYNVAPEVWLNVDKSFESRTASDVWSMGVVLYKLMSGRPPYRAASIKELGDKITSTYRPPFIVSSSDDDTIVYKFPKLQKIMFKMLNRHWERRLDAKHILIMLYNEYGYEYPQKS